MIPQLNTNTNTKEVVITLKEITDILEVRHDKSMTKIDKMIAEIPNFGSVSKMDIQYTSGKGRVDTTTTVCFTTESQAIAVGARLNNILLWKLVQKLHKPKSQLELAKEQVALLERLEQVEQEKQYAIATKAWISDKKTATAMNTASQLSKENESLKQQRDASKKFSTIRKQEKINQCKFKWNPLKKFCLENGLTIKQVDDDLYESVNSYPAIAWYSVYGVDIIREVA